MYYQLPNGKVVQMSIEEYLNLKEKDIQYLLSINAGEYMSNPWSGSVISKMSSWKDIEDDYDIGGENSEDLEESEFDFTDFFPDDFEDDPPVIDHDYDF